MKVLITLGPTQEPIDDVRYITNASSGKTGAALATEALSRGYEVTIIYGPVAIPLPDCKKIPAQTTSEMTDAVLKELRHGYDIFISTAAISDYAPKKTRGKIKSDKGVTLELVPLPKLIENVRKKNPKLFMVGFKAEYGLRKDELEARARNFLKQKKLNLVVANDVEKGIFGSEETEVLILCDEATKDLPRRTKAEMAARIWDEIELHTKKRCLV